MQQTIVTSVLVNWLLISPVISVQIDLPDELLPFFFASHKSLAADCKRDGKCPYKPHLDKNICWGYEDKCDKSRSYSHPICDQGHPTWSKSVEEQVSTWYNQSDFGYVKNFRDSIQSLCTPENEGDSSLECSEHLTFCRGKNLMIDFRDLSKRTKIVVYDTDVLSKGQIGGHCKIADFFKENVRSKMLGSLGSLQSWSPELQHFTQLDKNPLDRKSKLCDQIIKTPTFLMKIDAPVSMYHHYCDFFNLFATLFVNATNDTKPSTMFSTNVRIYIWRTMKYTSSFAPSFRTFSQYPIGDLNDFKGKRVCFRNVVFPLLPRMFYGLFYNTPLVAGCRNSGLFHAFSKFILHRLRIDQRRRPNLNKIRVTLLSRKTKYRRIMNDDELVEKLQENSKLVVQKAEITWQTEFTDQLAMMSETDVLIGMHGAGLTHMLFLPDWATVFELYNCEDPNCYFDLARLCGINYLTWQNDSLLTVDNTTEIEEEFKGHHPKHRNYYFDPNEFVRLVNQAVEHVKNYDYGDNAKHDEL